MPKQLLIAYVDLASWRRGYWQRALQQVWRWNIFHWLANFRRGCRAGTLISCNTGGVSTGDVSGPNDKTGFPGEDLKHPWDVDRFDSHYLLGPQIVLQHFPYRLSSLFVIRNRSPTSHPVSAVGIDDFPVQSHIGDSLTGCGTRIHCIGQSAGSNHVAALTVIRIRVEKVVGNILQCSFQLVAGETANRDTRVGYCSLRHYIFHT